MITHLVPHRFRAAWHLLIVILYVGALAFHIASVLEHLHDAKGDS